MAENKSELNTETKKKSGKKRGFETKYDANKLRELVLAGKTADEIQKEMEVVSRQSLRQWILKLIQTDKRFYEVPGLYVRGTTKYPMVNFKGDIRLTKKMLEFSGSTYKHGDQFEIEADNEKIILTRLGKSEE